MSRLAWLALWGIVRLVAAALVALAQLLLGLLGLAGLRGGRLAWLVATVAAVGWAAQVVGLRAGVALALACWLVWATRYQRARRRQRVAFRKLTRGLRTHTHAPHATPPRRASRVAAVADALAPPRLAADQLPEQALRALERYAAAWTHRHTHPVTGLDETSASDREGR
jgi:hypothetical protein